MHFEGFIGLLDAVGRGTRQQLEAGARDAGLFFDFALRRLERLFARLAEAGSDKSKLLTASLWITESLIHRDADRL